MPEHNLNIGQRPVTAAAGIAFHQGTKIEATHSRQVHDASYYMALLGTKKKQVEDEIAKLKAEGKEMETACSSHKNRQHSFDELLEEVRDLEETVADYNLAYEKDRHGTDAEEVSTLAVEMKEKNEALAQTLDHLFIGNQGRLEAIDEIEHDISKIHESFQRFLVLSDCATSTEYQSMMATLKGLKDEGIKVDSEIAALHSQIVEIESIISKRSDSDIHEKINNEAREISSLKSSIATLNEDLLMAQMEEDEARIYLLDKVKLDKSNISELEKEARAIDEELKLYDREELKLFEEEQNAQLLIQQGEEDTTSNEHMYWKNEDAREFLLSSKNAIEDLQSELERKNSLCSDLNDFLSSTITDLATKDRFESICSDVAFKARHLTNSKNTLDRLLGQKEQRKKEVRFPKHRNFLKCHLNLTRSILNSI